MKTFIRILKVLLAVKVLLLIGYIVFTGFQI